MARPHGLFHQVDEVAIDGKIGKALAEVDGAAFLCQLAHHGKDGRADVWQLAIQVHGSEFEGTTYSLWCVTISDSR